jgi:hypothetical protein
MKEAKESMRRINGFFENGILPFALEDFNILCCAQIEKLQKTFTTVVK